MKRKLIEVDYKIVCQINKPINHKYSYNSDNYIPG